MTAVSGFAVIDVETTGLDPVVHRVVEIAVVGLRPDLTVESAWTTLVNPATTAMGRVDIHHIWAEDVRKAPSFADVVGDVITQVRGRVLVAHNISFDAGFLAGEFARAGHRVNFRSLPGMDTLDLARRHWPGQRANLAICCERVGIENSQAHSALADALATAQLFAYLLSCSIPGTQSQVTTATSRAMRVAWPALPLSTVPLLPRHH
jgi:DNA polymerase-3 subunit epsilon